MKACKYCTIEMFDLTAVHQWSCSCKNKPSLLLPSQAEVQTVHLVPLHQSSGGESPGLLADEATQHLPLLKDWLLYRDINVQQF